MIGSGNSSYAAERGPGGLYSDLPSLLTVVGNGSAFSYPLRGDLYSTILPLSGIRRCREKVVICSEPLGAYNLTHLELLRGRCSQWFAKPDSDYQ